MRAVNQPESWWGWHGWDQPQALSITQVLQAGTMSPRLAAAFWLGLERGASFAFASEPPGAGKTTVLTALLALAPPQMAAYFTRGWGETFELPLPSDQYPTYLMVNEMSDHLPVYSWGPYVVRAFELLQEGYSMCTTLHADTVEEVIDQLVDDCGVPRELLANLTFVVPLAIVRREAQALRRVHDVGMLAAGEDGLAVRRIATWDQRSDAFSVLATDEERCAFAERLGIDAAGVEGELARREAFLQRLVDEDVTEIAAVQAAIDSFRAD